MAGLKLGGRWAAKVGFVVIAAVMTASASDKDKKDAATGETRMTKDQAKELFKSVDDILGFASKDSKLPIEHSVKRTLISRDEVNKFLRERFDKDESTKRLERSEIVLKKFGLLDRDFHLQTFLVSLLTEQIAGYYDDKTKTVNLLDWIAPDEQKSVLAHELTHALQDQKVDLSKWSEVGPKGIAKTHAEDVDHIRFGLNDAGGMLYPLGEQGGRDVGIGGEVHLDLPSVLVRHEGAAGGHHHGPGQDARQQEEQSRLPAHHSSVPHRPVQRAFVAVMQLAIKALDRQLDARLLAWFTHGILGEEVSAQCRRQG